MKRKAIQILLVVCILLSLSFPAFCANAPGTANPSADQSGKGVSYYFYLLAVAAASYYFYRKRKDREKEIKQADPEDQPAQLPTDQVSNTEKDQTKERPEN